MAQENKDPKVNKAQRIEVLKTVTDELDRRAVELRKDIYGSREYCDGVREEVRRMQEWLMTQMR